MELGSYFLFLQEQIKDIIIILKAGYARAVAEGDVLGTSGSCARSCAGVCVRPAFLADVAMYVPAVQGARDRIKFQDDFWNSASLGLANTNCQVLTSPNNLNKENCEYRMNGTTSRILY